MLFGKRIKNKIGKVLAINFADNSRFSKINFFLFFSQSWKKLKYACYKLDRTKRKYTFCFVSLMSFWLASTIYILVDNMKKTKGETVFFALLVQTYLRHTFLHVHNEWIHPFVFYSYVRMLANHLHLKNLQRFELLGSCPGPCTRARKVRLILTLAILPNPNRWWIHKCVNTLEKCITQRFVEIFTHNERLTSNNINASHKFFHNVFTIKCVHSQIFLWMKECKFWTNEKKSNVFISH